MKQSSQAGDRKHILVVDDDDDIRLLNAEVLRNSGYLVDVAEDGLSAWEAVGLNHYDLLITDNEMPKLNGMGLLKRIRDAGIMLPAIVASGTFPDDLPVSPPGLQIEAFLPKPYRLEELQAVVKKALLHAAEAGNPPLRGRPDSSDSV